MAILKTNIDCFIVWGYYSVDTTLRTPQGNQEQGAQNSTQISLEKIRVQPCMGIVEFNPELQSVKTHCTQTQCPEDHWNKY
jgi:hypothetical protein